MNKKLIIFLVVIAAIIAGLFALNSILKTKIVIDDAGKEDQAVVQEPVNSVSVPDQAGGTEIYIENVSLEAPGYVVVHRSEDGKPGAVIGASELLPKGDTANLIISLDEEVVEGDILFAMLHSDDGDGEFTFPGPDVPILDDEGNIVMVRFSILSEGALENEFKL